MSSAAGGGGRVLLAAGTMTYRHGADFAEPLADLDGVPEALGWVVETLTGLGYEPELTRTRRYLLDPTLPQLRQAVREAAGSAPVVVVYYTGHGMKPDRSPYYLVTAAARPDDLEGTALEARQLLGLAWRKDAHGNELPDEEQPQVLVILDCCFAGAGGIEALRESLQGIGSPKVWVLASASSVEWAQQGRFAAALTQALLDPDVGASQKALALDWVVEKINTTLGSAGQRARLFPPGGESTGIPPFLPNRKRVPGVEGLTVEQQHWVGKLRGAPADTTTAGFYVTGHTGRIRVVEDLASWMRDPERGGLAVVTGSPGCGKSAMLALPVLLTDRKRRAALAAGAASGSLVARAAGLFDGLPVFGVHARGMNPYQAASAIAHSLGGAADNPEDLLKDLDLDDHREPSPRIVVIDALDEARDPRRLLTDLLVPLASRPGLRVVIGARRRVLPPAAATSLLVDLDSGDYRDPQALADYAHQLLIAAHEPEVASPYRGPDDTAATVAAAIAEKATEWPTVAGHQERQESFLLAQLLARAVRGRPQVLDITRTDWADQLPAGVGAAFDEDLRLLGEREPTARALLAALAWAKGLGLPWEQIWVPVAQALAPYAGDAGAGALRLDRNDVRWLLDNAGAYIAEDVGPGERSVFRPFHDLVAAHLRGQPTAERTAADAASRDAYQQRRQQVERDITRVLLDSVPTSSNGKVDWRLAHPYLCTYLAQHAHAAGPDTFAELTADLDFLAVADPAILTPLLTPTDPALRSVARSYRRARPLLGPSARDNAAYLQEATVAQTGSHPAGQRIPPTYRTVMAHVRRDDSLLTLIGGSSSVHAVAFGTDADGRPLLASGGSDGTVRLWDPTNGTPVGEPLLGYFGTVYAVAFGTSADGRPLLASGGSDWTVRRWDLTTGTPIGDPLLGHSRPVTAVAFGTDTDGRPLLASASENGTIQLWNPTTGTPVGGPLTRDLLTDAPLTGAPIPNTRATSTLSPVAIGAGADGRPLLASGGGDGTVWLWDPTTGTPVGDPLRGQSPVWSVAFGVDANGRLLLASGGDDGTVRLWDPATGTPISDQVTVGHRGPVTALAFGTDADERALLASGSLDGTVRRWDPATGTPIGDPLHGHTGRVLALAFGIGADGRALLASASLDGTVRLWPAGPDPTGPPPAERLQASVSAVAFGIRADGRPLLASASADRTVRLWDPTTGTPIGDPLPGHPRVNAVALGTDADGRPLLASGGSDNMVRLWYVTTRAPLGYQLTGHSDPVLAVAFGTDADGRPLLASGGEDGTVRRWEPATGGEDGAMLFEPATGGENSTVRLWDPITGPESSRPFPVGDPLLGHSRPVTAVAFGTDADGRPLLASGGGDGVRRWDPTNGTPVGEPLLGHTGTVTAVAFGTSADGRPLLASGGGDGTVRRWDPTTGTPIGDPLLGHSRPVTAVAFGTDTDGRPLLASASTDGTVRLWDPTTGTTVLKLLRRTLTTAIATQRGHLAIADPEGITVIEVIGSRR